ncbi:MAG: hypothetical protein RL026_315 [Pseudomonadota bacterium]|jgi:molybdopterin molybdotransferase
MTSHIAELRPQEATQCITSRLAALPAESVALATCRGRILQQHVHAERDNPPFHRVCMDGVAVDSRALAAGQRDLQLQGTQAAGTPPLRLGAGAVAIEVMTGAVLPEGADCVIPVEDYQLVDGRLRLSEAAVAAPWLNIQQRGSDGEQGSLMLSPGQRLGAAEVAVLASAGLASARVSRLPRVCVVSTGDELVEPGQPVAGHQIRRSNAHAVVAALQLHGCAATRDDHLRDDAGLMRERLAGHLATHDVLVLSGGVSKGKFDHVPAVLQALGVEQVFHRVAQRPGRPLWFGIGPQGQAVFGLPGNPVSTLVGLVRYVLPALEHMSGAAPRALPRVQLAETLDGRRLTFFMPVRLRLAGGLAVAVPHATSGSGDFLALAGTDGFVELPPRDTPYPAGFEVDYHAW